MRPELITIDAYAALTDYRSSPLPVVENERDLQRAHVEDFLDVWHYRTTHRIIRDPARGAYSTSSNHTLSLSQFS